MTARQREILSWLWHYPQVYITWVGPLEATVGWTATWISAAAREHMVSTIGGTEVKKQVAGRAPTSLNGPTPRLRFGTFKALLRRGYIEVRSRREPRPGWTPMAYYQLSMAGKEALLRENPSRD